MLMQIDGTFIVAFISFLIFLILIKLILYRPITGVIEARQKYFEKNSLTVDETNDKIASLKQEKDQKLKEAKKSANLMYNDEIEKLKKETDLILSQSKNEALKAIELNKNKLKKESEAVKAEIKSEMTSIVTSIVSKVLNEQVTISLDENKINECLKIR